MKKLATIFAMTFCCLGTTIANTPEQLSFKCEQMGEIKSAEKFSPEDGWLMLTQDFFIINPEALKGQIETIYPSRKDKDKVKSILITAQLQGSDITSEVRVPIYNLSVDVVNKELTINKTNTQNAIHVSDNMPLKSLGTNPIDTKISVEAISADQPNRVYQFAARQLSQIGKIKNDNSAMNKLSDELGKLIETKMKDQQFVFNSTISLFGDIEENRKTFSICLYEIAPSNKDIERNFTNAELKKLVDSNEKVSHAALRKCITNKTKPIIAVVNYKSAYKPNMRSVHQINNEYVNERIVKTRSLYLSKLIDEAVFTQEDELNDFMRKYLQLDKEAKRYKEDKAKGSSLLSTNIIVDRYIDLMGTKMQKDVKKEFLYEQTFKPYYDDITKAAKMGMKDGKELERLERLVNVLIMEKDPDTISSVAKVKENFEILNSSESLVEDTKWEANVEDLKNKYEEAYYEKFFKAKLEKLNEGDPKANAALAESLKKEIEESKCEMCMYNALEYYFEPLESKINAIRAEEEAQAQAEKAAALKAAKKKAMMKKKKK